MGRIAAVEDFVIRLLRLSVGLLLVPLAAAAQSEETGFLDRSVTLHGVHHRYQVYVPATYAGSDQRLPVILFLHGAGERGSDGLRQTLVGLPAQIRDAPSRYPAIVVMPQVPEDSSWIDTFADVSIAALDQTLAEFRTDPDRVYLTGLSMGGNGTWHLAYRFPERFAALAVVCGYVTAPDAAVSGLRGAIPADSGDVIATLADRVARLPIWIAHGETDPLIPVAESRRVVEALKALGGSVRYVEYLGVGHNVWDPTYGSPQFTEWLFAQRRGS
jgi:predicted peptidase